jgi:hypothetical protein
MKPKKIKDMRGILCRSIDGRVFFRVRNPNGSFRDFEIANWDLEIQIVDSDAYIYRRKGKSIIDYGPATLGIDSKKQSKPRRTTPRSVRR